MYHPESSYRIQFHKGFNFSSFEKIIPYLNLLGIKTIYASPIFAASAGSTHGYDGIDPNKINPEIGSLDQFRKIAAKLKELGMGWIQDFVPNHMAFSLENKWLYDLLKNGEASVYKDYFDHDAATPLMVPFLGKELEQAIADAELTLNLTGEDWTLEYFDQHYPLNAESITYLEKQLKDQEDKTLAAKQDPTLVLEVCKMQHYRLCYWQETNTKINYRRFFTINGLISLNMQQEEVFRSYHALLLQLIEEGLIQGIRIDHIDGLYDPEKYLERLREATGSKVYIIAEKILEKGEKLPRWPLQGSTGYDFLGQLNGLLSSAKGSKQLDLFYKEIAGNKIPLRQQAYLSKAGILKNAMQGELSNLVSLFSTTVGKALPATVSEQDIRKIIAALLVYCPVYRLYPSAQNYASGIRPSLDELLDKIKHDRKVPAAAIDYFIKIVLPAKLPQDPEKQLHFWRRLMQLSGPLMAKGIEDTLMYTYHRALVHNEVGDQPENEVLSIEDFQHLMQERQAETPAALNATATHDTKRGEDARARLQLLAHNATSWIQLCRRLLQLSDQDGGLLAPEEKYMLMQAIYAALPMNDESIETGRLKAYVQKAAREAKKYSGWEQPDEEYENALLEYAKKLSATDTEEGSLLRAYTRQQKVKIERNEQAQLILKCTCPGLPDIYQGTEMEDLSFVDPDNRRPVDFKIRMEQLEALLAAGKEDAKAASGTKLKMLYQLLQTRKQYPLLFSEGSYIPVPAGKKHIAFLRRYANDWALIVVPLGGVQEKTGIKLPAQAPAQWKDISTGQEGKLSQLREGKNGAEVYVSAVPVRARKAGILLPLFSLPAPFGIGDLGQEAYHFAQSLSQAGQGIWQLLPLNPVSKAQLYSPYAALSAFAGDPIYIDLFQLAEAGWLEADKLKKARLPFRKTVDYEKARNIKMKWLRQAFERYRAATIHDQDFTNWVKEQAYWLDDYASYSVLRQHHGQKAWPHWEESLRERETSALQQFRETHEGEYIFQEWLQYIFHQQWQRLKGHCHRNGVQLTGDLPFYMGIDSADVWAHRNYFAVNSDGSMTGVAGVPPDYFSSTGQHWGMPVYNWKALKKDQYQWWLERLARNVALYDAVRLDHFRAFYDYWEIPGTASTAKEGTWQQGPQDHLFRLIQKRFPTMPFLAEDLGEIHQGVFEFKDRYKLPGMRVLQFGFEQYDAALRDLPHQFAVNDTAYSGTHDNNTLHGWFDSLSKQAKADLEAYAGHPIYRKKLTKTITRLLYSSVASDVIVPMADITGQGAEARINTPATIVHNWQWRSPADRLDKDTERWLLQMAKRFLR